MKIAKAKEQVKKARKKEEKELKFLIRDFYELKVLFKMIKDAEEEKSKGNHKEVESKIKKILRKLRGGITGSEERIERRMARSYTQMRDFIKDTEPYLAKVYPHEVEGINNLLRQAEMYNADLEKLGSRGGEIEDKLRAAKKDPSQLDAAFEDIKKALRDVQAFEEIINQLLHKTKEILSEFEKLKYQKIPTVTEFSSGMSVISVGEGKLVVLNPNYLLGKHGAKGGEQVASKFYQLKTIKQMYRLLLKYAKPKILSGDRVEIKEARAGVIVGQDGLIETKDASKWGVLAQEDVRGSKMNVVETTKNIPVTKLLNIILVKFNPQYGANVDKDFEEKYGISFNDYDVYAVMTAFPGKYAPPATDSGFWGKHALLKKISKQEDSSIEILDFEGDSHGDYETEYHMNFKITGTIGGKPFTVGKGDEDIYVTGAHKFDNIDELAEWIEEREHDATGVMAKYNEDEFEHVLKMILDKMKSEPKWRAKLEELREHCNDTADEMQDSWNSGW